MMLRRFIDKILHSMSHDSHRRRRYSSSDRHYGKRYSSSSGRHYGKRYSSSYGHPRPFGSSSDYKRRHGRMGHDYYKSRRYSSS
ncbi:Uncharacterised protein [Paenibacillus macerans]|uniref:Uncharacterized protein n=1 Tax=Paenibacillus macerans TaxID=44252 RepID=A0A090ZJ93_PAEMA|nr:hypothetical protein DJ90_4054 [Paenibacillus macerans]SUA83165.1 Uncharacterised protein [Paenibacillus macerans]